MNFYLKPHPIMVRLAPGLLVVAAFLLRHYNWSYQQFAGYLPASQTKSFLVGLTILVGAWIVGQALDAARDVLEHLLDPFWKIEWDFFFWAPPAQVEAFEDHYFNYYVCCANTALGLTALLSVFLLRGSCPAKIHVVLLSLLAFFGLDAVLLRREILGVLRDWNSRNPAKARQRH